MRKPRLDRARVGRAKRRAVRLVIDVAARAKAKVRNPRMSTRVSPRENMLTGGEHLWLYFDVGASAQGQIEAGLASAGAPAPRRILDLPCGYGRVLRHLRAAWPDAEITAMELDPEATRFCANAFGARPVVSRQPLWTVTDAGDDYDLLWCGSLLTHFDAADWVPVLTYFRDRLAVGGTLIFTTHGDRPIDLLAGEPDAVRILGPWVGDYGMGQHASAMAVAARTTGFAFRSYDGGDPAFGLSVSTPAWVTATLAEVSGLELVHHVPHGWFEHQDVWTCRRLT